MDKAAHRTAAGITAMALHAWRMTRRDWRAGELRLLVAALAVAVAALSAVGFFVDRMNAALQRDAAQLLGGDLVVRSDYPLQAAWRNEAARRGLRMADTVLFPSMATTGSGDAADARLVAVKAVSSDYPLRGALTLSEAGKPHEVRGAPAAGTAWVDPAFIDTRGVHEGELLQLGASRFRIAATISNEKDRGAGFMNFAPRVMIALPELQATGLVGQGARVTYRTQLAGDGAAIAAYQRWLDAEIKRSDVRGVQLESLESGRPEMRTTLDRARQFLSLVGLLTAMLAALAIAMAARRFMQRHVDACAMLRCLGLTQGEVTRLYVIEFVLVGIAGGGFAALDYAAWQPQRLEKLVIAGSNGQFSEPEMQDFYARIAVPGLTGRIEVRPFLEVGVAYRAEDPEGFARFIAMEHAARQEGAPAQPLRTPNTFAKVATIRTPTLVLMGGADLLAPPALMRTWSRHLPDVRYAEIGDAGHSINWERPEAFNRHMLGFLLD